MRSDQRCKSASCLILYAGDTRSSQETCTRNWYQKLAWKCETSSSQFLAPKQLSDQSRCTVRVMCQTFSMLEQCVLLHARNLYKKKTCTRLAVMYASFWYKKYWYKTTCTSFWYKFLERVSPALDRPNCPVCVHSPGFCFRWSYTTHCCRHTFAHLHTVRCFLNHLYLCDITDIRRQKLIFTILIKLHFNTANPN